MSKFDKLDEPMSYSERSKLLSWFVDSMRSEVHQYFEVSNLFNSMTGEERIQLCADLDRIHQNCADLLFEMTNNKNKGKLVQEDRQLSELHKKVKEF